MPAVNACPQREPPTILCPVLRNEAGLKKRNCLWAVVLWPVMWWNTLDRNFNLMQSC